MKGFILGVAASIAVALFGLDTVVHTLEAAQARARAEFARVYADAHAARREAQARHAAKDRVAE
jgi:hypothetical protein